VTRVFVGYTQNHISESVFLMKQPEKTSYCTKILCANHLGIMQSPNEKRMSGFFLFLFFFVFVSGCE